MSQPVSSRKILVIDDQPAIHSDFHKILSPPPIAGGTDLARLRAAVKGPGVAAPIKPASSHSFGTYVIEDAHQGEEGFKKVLAAHDAGDPYSVVYIDMRMPPGWDGLQTMKEIWHADPEIQIVICTAFSDQPWSEIDEMADKSDRVLVLKKPFDAVEVKRMTSTLSAKWRLARAAAARRAELEEIIQLREETFAIERRNDQKRLAELEALVRRLTNQAIDLTTVADAAPKIVRLDAGSTDVAPARYSLNGEIPAP